MLPRGLKLERWVLSPHAVARMADRGVSIAELESVLKSPDFVSAQGPKFIYSKNISHRNDNLLAAVVIEKKEDLWVVITIMVNFQKK